MGFIHHFSKRALLAICHHMVAALYIFVDKLIDCSVFCNWVLSQASNSRVMSDILNTFVRLPHRWHQTSVGWKSILRKLEGSKVNMLWKGKGKERKGKGKKISFYPSRFFD